MSKERIAEQTEALFSNTSAKAIKAAEEKEAKELIKGFEVPEGYELRPAKRSELIQCYTTKSIKAQLTKIAKSEKMRVNELLNILITSYLKAEKDKANS